MCAFDLGAIGEEPEPLITDEIWAEILSAQDEEGVVRLIESKMGLTLTELDKRTVFAELEARSNAFFLSHPAVAFKTDDELQNEGYRPIGFIDPDKFGDLRIFHTLLRDYDDLTINRVQAGGGDFYNTWTRHDVDLDPEPSILAI